MVLVEVNFFSDVKMLTKDGKIEIEIPDQSKVLDLLKILVRNYGESLDRYIFDDKNYLNRHLAIIVNGRGIGVLNGLDTTLREGDSISLMPAIGGG